MLIAVKFMYSSECVDTCIVRDIVAEFRVTTEILPNLYMNSFVKNHLECLVNEYDNHELNRYSETLDNSPKLDLTPMDTFSKATITVSRKSN